MFKKSKYYCYCCFFVTTIVLEVVLVRIVHDIFKRKCKVFIGACLSALKKKGSSLKGKVSLPLKLGEGLEEFLSIRWHMFVQKCEKSTAWLCPFKHLCAHNLSKLSIGNMLRLTYFHKHTNSEKRCIDWSFSQQKRGGKKTYLIYASVSIDCIEWTIIKMRNRCPIHWQGQSDNARRQGMMPTQTHAFTAPLI